MSSSSSTAATNNAETSGSVPTTAETSSVPTSNHPSSSSSSSSQLGQMLRNINQQATLQPQHVLVIGNLAFGNAAAKQLVAGLPGLIDEKLILAYYCDSEYCRPNNTNNDTDDDNHNKNRRQFLKTLRACVVNCAPARAKCGHAQLYRTMVDDLRQAFEKAKDEESKSKSSYLLPLVQDYVTTWCALCINDDGNTGLLKEALASSSSQPNKNNVTLRDFVPDQDDDTDTNIEDTAAAAAKKIRQDIEQRMAFLEALMEAL